MRCESKCENMQQLMVSQHKYFYYFKGVRLAGKSMPDVIFISESGNVKVQFIR